MNNYLDTLKEKFTTPIGIGKSAGEEFIENKEHILRFKEFPEAQKMTYTDQYSIMQLVRVCEQEKDEGAITTIKELLKKGKEKDNYSDLADRTLTYLKGFYKQKIEKLEGQEQNEEKKKSIDRYKKSIHMIENYYTTAIENKKQKNEKITLIDLPSPGYAVMPNFALTVIGSKINLSHIISYIEKREKSPAIDAETIINNIIAEIDKEKKTEGNINQEEVKKLKDKL